MQTIALGGGALAVRLDRGILLVRNAWDANWVEPQNNIITDFEEIFFGKHEFVCCYYCFGCKGW